MKEAGNYHINSRFQTIISCKGRKKESAIGEGDYLDWGKKKSFFMKYLI
jgi:hypothetical protein